MEPARPIWLPDTKGFLAIAIVALFGVAVFILMFKQSPADQTVFAVLTTLLGVLASQLKEISGYYFGSSASSASKDATQGRLVEKLSERVGEPTAVVPPVVAVAPVAPTTAGPYTTPLPAQGSTP